MKTRHNNDWHLVKHLFFAEYFIWSFYILSILIAVVAAACSPERQTVRSVSRSAICRSMWHAQIFAISFACRVAQAGLIIVARIIPGWFALCFADTIANLIWG
jgi:hypothetical protein